MENELVKIETLPADVQDAINKSGLPHEKAQVYIGKFLPHMNILSELEAEIKNINHENPTAEDAKKARALRLRYVPNRTAAEKVKKNLKESILTEGRLIDSMYNVVENASKIKEKFLEDIEKHQERIDAAAKDKLQAEREAELGKYVSDPKTYPLREFDEIAWKQLLEGQIAAFEKREAENKLAALTKEREDLLRPYMPIPAFQLGSISQEAFDDLLTKAKDAHFEKIQAEQLERERQKRTNDRIELLSSLGFTYNAEREVYSRSFTQDAVTLCEYTKKELEHDKDEAWAANTTRIKGIVDDEIKFINEKNRLNKILATNRMNAMRPYMNPDIISKLSLNFFWEMTDADWDKYLATHKSEWEEKEASKKAQKELADKKAAEDKVAAEAAEKAERDAQKGDADKMDDLIADLDALKTKYSFKSKKHNRIMTAAVQKLDELIQNIIKTK